MGVARSCGTSSFRDRIGTQHDRLAQYRSQLAQTRVIIGEEPFHLHQHMRHRRALVPPQDHRVRRQAGRGQRRGQAGAADIQVQLPTQTERSRSLASGGVVASTKACTPGAPSGRGAQNGSRATTYMRGCSFCSMPVHQASRAVSVSDGIGITATAAEPRLTSAIAWAARPIRMQRRQHAEMLARHLGEPVPAVRLDTPPPRTVPCMAVVPASISRHMRTSVCGGRPPLCCRSSRRMIEASRPGRYGAALAGFCHLFHDLRPLDQQRVQGVIDAVQFGTQAGEAARPAILRRWLLVRRRGGGRRRVDWN